MPKTQLEQWDETAANNTDRGGVNIGEGCNPSDVNNAMRELMSQVAKWLGDDTVASATTADLGAVPGRYINITGTTTITGLGTIKAGTIKFVKFAGALTLTHSSALIMPGGVNRTTQAGDTAIFVSEGSGNWRCLMMQESRPSRAPDIILEERQTVGTNGGTFTGGSFQTRILNTERRDAYSECTLNAGTGVFTLSAGTWYVEMWSSAYFVERHQIKLYDNTGPADLVVGSSELAGGSGAVSTKSFGDDVFTLSVTSSLTLEHQCETTRASNGRGIAANIGPEIYAKIKLWKLA